jgi:osmoprotectant transport system substrate-binding protein
MKRALISVLVIMMSLSACSPGTSRGQATPPGAPRDSIIVGSFDFAESELLSELYATVLQYHGYPVRRAFGLGPREVIEPALQQGRIDLVPEYLGTALAFVSLGKATRRARACSSS